MHITEWGGQLAGMASEEMDAPYQIPNCFPKGKYLLVFDPLDGSSNIDVNVAVGSIFSILRVSGDHGSDIQDASEIWFAAMGPGISGKGEIKMEGQLYQQQFAQTIAKLMGYTFKAEHPIAKEITEVLKK